MSHRHNGSKRNEKICDFLPFFYFLHISRNNNRRCIQKYSIKEDTNEMALTLRRNLTAVKYLLRIRSQFGFPLIREIDKPRFTENGGEWSQEFSFIESLPSHRDSRVIEELECVPTRGLAAGLLGWVIFVFVCRPNCRKSPKIV